MLLSWLLWTLLGFVLKRCWRLKNKKEVFFLCQWNCSQGFFPSIFTIPSNWVTWSSSICIKSAGNTFLMLVRRWLPWHCCISSKVFLKLHWIFLFSFIWKQGYRGSVYSSPSARSTNQPRCFLEIAFSFFSFSIVAWSAVYMYIGIRAVWPQIFWSHKTVKKFTSINLPYFFSRTHV